MAEFVYQDLVVKNRIGLVTITQVLVLNFERQKSLFLQNLAKNSALKRLRRHAMYIGVRSLFCLEIVVRLRHLSTWSALLQENEPVGQFGLLVTIPCWLHVWQVSFIEPTCA